MIMADGAMLKQMLRPSRVDADAMDVALAMDLKHIPFGWNQPNGICPVKPATPARAIPIR
jgi:hypothetical protein